MKEKIKRLQDNEDLFLETLHAVEKECLRIDEQGDISLSRHPYELGSTLLHPFISTDFSEAQLELISPTFSSEQKLMEFMTLLHRVVFHHLDDETIWPFSAPGRIRGEVPIAKYGHSNFAYEKELYRLGLQYRYGSQMQTLSGVHYNLSFGKNLLHFLDGDPISEIYLKITRNYLRFGWLTTYLFGASPVYDESFFKSLPKDFVRMAPETVGLPYATSLRMSEYGYYSKIQTQIGISFNSLEEYIRELEYAISNSAEQWQKIPKENQINDHIIQIEAEHYSRIRPKPPVNLKLRALDALKNSGITYLEIRGLDLNPNVIEGIEEEQINYLYIFLLYCLLKESPPLSVQEEKNLTHNQNLVALQGRNPQLNLTFNSYQQSLNSWANRLLEEMEPVAELLDHILMTEAYTDALKLQIAKVQNPEATPSAQLVDILTSKQMSFHEFGLAQSLKLKAETISKPIPKPFLQQMDKLAMKSHQEQKELEQYDDFILKGYEDLELSTQALLREAFKQGIEVEELDRKDQFFKLKKENHVEFVKKATMTSRDSLMTYLQMENKAVTKKLLLENGVSVPEGVLCFDTKEALSHINLIHKGKLVIKPNRMNYGIGIYIVEKDDLKGYEEAVGKAFQHGQEVVIERFLEGKEYRFLVIDNQTVAICHRIPANVTGDGMHTIRELIEIKNHDIKNHKVPKYYLRAGQEEFDFLKQQGLTFESIPEEGKQIFTRENSNVSTGGDSIDVTDKIHPGYRQIAEKSASVVGAVFCGVDMMIQNIDQPPTSDNHGIIELNFNPALWIHRYPTYGEKRYVEKAVLEALGF